MAIGSAKSFTVPTVSVTAGPTYATQVSAALQEIKDDLEADINSASITIDANLDWNGYEVGEVGALELEDKSAAFSGPTNVLKAYSRSGEFYWNDGAGNQVQVTSNGSLNAAALGGINGDYGGGNPASVSFDDANSVFVFTQDPGVSAKIDVGSILIRDEVASAYAITIESPAALAAAYSLILPAALPAATGILLVTTAGTVGTLSTTLTPALTSLTTTGTLGVGTNATVGGTLAVTGASTFTGTLTASNDASVVGDLIVGDDLNVFGDVIAAGTVTADDYLHGSLQLNISPLSAFLPSLGSASISGGSISSGAALTVCLPISLMVGDRITAVTVAGADTGLSVTARLKSQTHAGVVSNRSDLYTSPAGSAAFSSALANVTALVVAADTNYYVEVAFAETFQFLRGAIVTYDRS
jgi:hypothetical protein